MHLFTYGTLMFPDVWQIVVGKKFDTLPAQLPNYQIFRVKNQLYPGIVKCLHSGDSPLTSDLRPLTSVSGLLHLNLDARSLQRLDAFEGHEYRREPVEVTTARGDTLTADTYIIPNESRHLLTDELWTPIEFQAKGDLAVFVSRYAGFHRLG